MVTFLQMGCDTSYELVKICNTRGFEVLTSNCLQLPFRDSTFDAVICIAVIHHLASVVCTGVTEHLLLLQIL